MSNWTWLLIGVGAGYFLARTGAGFGGGFSVSANLGASGGPPPGSGSTPLDQPTGSAPYQQVGAWNPLLPGQFPDLIDNGASAVIIDTDQAGRDYLS